MPCASLAAAQHALDRDRLAFVPTGVLAPGLARLAARRARLGGGRLVHLLARLLDPYLGAALGVVATGEDGDARLLAAFFLMTGTRYLLLEGSEGEPFASPFRRPVLELVRDHARERLFPAESAAVRARTQGLETMSVADWTRRALRGEVPLPLPLVNQVACCLYGAGYASDINQAKAIAALETGSLVPA
jgi:anthranilate phosphoribosyltransferase